MAAQIAGDTAEGLPSRAIDTLSFVHFHQPMFQRELLRAGSKEGKDGALSINRVGIKETSQILKHRKSSVRTLTVWSSHTGNIYSQSRC